MITIDDLRELEVPVPTINKLLGASSYCTNVRVDVPNGETEEGVIYQTRIARNKKQLASHLGHKGAEIVT